MTTTTSPSAAIAIPQPVFTHQEQLALAGFLAGCTGLTRQAYALDLRARCVTVRVAAVPAGLCECFHAGVRSLGGLDYGSAFWAEIRLFLGPGPQDGINDEWESHFGDFTCGLDRSVSRAPAGLGLGFRGHHLSPVIGSVGRWVSGPGAAS
jgi:hypothetical protein